MPIFDISPTMGASTAFMTYEPRVLRNQACILSASLSSPYSSMQQQQQQLMRAYQRSEAGRPDVGGQKVE